MGRQYAGVFSAGGNMFHVDVRFIRLRDVFYH